MISSEHSPSDRSDSDADAGANHHLMAVDVIGLAHDRDDPMREGGSIRWCGDGHCTMANSSPPMRATVSVSRTTSRSRIGDHLQKLVTGGMPERVVHMLEVIKVENVGRNELAALGAGQGVFQLLIEEHAVGQTGQRVVNSHMGNLGL